MYQVILTNKEKGFYSLEILTECIISHQNTLTGVLFIEILVKYSTNLTKWYKLVYLIPFQYKKIATLNESSFNFEITYAHSTAINYKPQQFFPELPLPDNNVEVALIKYTSENRLLASKEID